MEIKTEELFVGYQANAIIKDLTTEIPKGKITSLIGPNGSGKSTFLKALARVLHPMKGVVLLEGQPVHQLASKEVAKNIALLSQNSEANIGLTVKEVVSYGRYPYQKGFSGLNQTDYEKIDWAIQVTGLSNFANRGIHTLSGGQRQRVWIAMALAQDTDILILDEPTTFLDPAHQLEILSLLNAINKKHGKTIIMSIHDLNHASRFSDHILALKKGKLLFEGPPEQVFTEDIMQNIFEIKASFTTNGHDSKPILLTYDLIEGSERNE